MTYLRCVLYLVVFAGQGHHQRGAVAVGIEVTDVEAKVEAVTEVVDPDATETHPPPSPPCLETSPTSRNRHVMTSTRTLTASDQDILVLKIFASLSDVLLLSSCVSPFCFVYSRNSRRMERFRTFVLITLTSIYLSLFQGFRAENLQ